ncbi:MAG: glutamate 5-kinase [Acidimicrobiales bacterium]|nr:glutamate 5-kinase [Acidimicrobiales bacterium]
MTVVVKIGTSSLTDDVGHIRRAAIDKLSAEVARVRADGTDVVIVSSGAIGAGLPALGFLGERPKDPVTLQALSAVGQARLMRQYEEALAVHGLVCGQVLLSPLDFFERTQYLHARNTLGRLIELGVVPIVNENDAVADDAIRFGDNDRIAALVAQLVDATLLVLLTDQPGVLTADPRFDDDASLIEEIVRIDKELESVAGGAGTSRGSGGMASKLSAAKIAAWSGVPTVIAAAHRDSVLPGAVANESVGTFVHPRATSLPAKKLWIAFAVGMAGRITVDDGARRALEQRGTSLLAVGVTDLEGAFLRGDAVEVAGPDGAVFAKGLVTMSADDLRSAAGRQTRDLPASLPDEVIHRDELVLLPG